MALRLSTGCSLVFTAALWCINDAWTLGYMRMLLYTVDLYRYVTYANSPVTMEALTRQNLIWVYRYAMPTHLRHRRNSSSVSQWPYWVNQWQPCQLISSTVYVLLKMHLVPSIDPVRTATLPISSSPIGYVLENTRSWARRSWAPVNWNTSHIATHLGVLVLLVVRATLLEKASVGSNQIGMKVGRIVLQINLRIDCRGFLIWRHTFKMAVMTSFYVRLPLATAYVAASAGCPLAHRARVTSVPAP